MVKRTNKYPYYPNILLITPHAERRNLQFPGAKELNFILSCYIYMCVLNKRLLQKCSNGERSSIVCGYRGMLDAERGGGGGGGPMLKGMKKRSKVKTFHRWNRRNKISGANLVE